MIEGKRRRGAEDEMARETHHLNGYEFEPTPGDSEGQGGLSWHAAVHGVAKSDTT